MHSDLLYLQHPFKEGYLCLGSLSRLYHYDVELCWDFVSEKINVFNLDLKMSTFGDS